MNPHFKNRGVFILISGIILLAVLGFSYFSYGLKPRGTDFDFDLKIQKGEGVKEIAAVLSRARLIRSIAVFKLYVVLTGKAQYLKPGTYKMNGRLSVPEIADLLIKGSAEEIEVTIPEGTTVKEINKILSSANVLEPDLLLNFNFKNNSLIEDFPFIRGVDNLEGLLYPDTYRFKINSSVEEVVKKFFSNFQEKIWPLVSDKSNWYQTLILASILEKEVPVFVDQQLVAGILNKRVEKGMPIQADATVVYAKCQGDVRFCSQRQLTKNDLKIDSPYNSYLQPGWPPTPIANMNQSAVRAALNPQVSNYWYYLSASQTKETIFSKTLEEHNKNRFQYLKSQ